MKLFFTKVKNKLHNIRRDIWLWFLRRRNKNHSFSLITNDCVGGVISHDLGEQFRSPTVNLWIPGDNYLEFVKDLKYYLSCEVIETPDPTLDYPVGTIVPRDADRIPVRLNFMHYKSFDEAYAKWKERSARVDYDNLYYIWHYDGDDEEWIKEFDSLNIKKLCILHKPMAGVQSFVITYCYNVEPHNGKLLDIKPRSVKRYLDDIDYLGFLNAEK